MPRWHPALLAIAALGCGPAASTPPQHADMPAAPAAPSPPTTVVEPAPSHVPAPTPHELALAAWSAPATGAGPTCIVDAIEHAKSRAARERLTASAPEIEIVGDLDDDGALDARVYFTASCAASSSCKSFLYLSSNGCRRYVGSVLAASLTVKPELNRRVHDLEVWTADGCAGAAGTITGLRFDGYEYRSVRRGAVSCPCPIGDEERPIPSRCRDVLGAELYADVDPARFVD